MPCKLQHQGFCMRCRVLWTWEGDLQQQHALCPECSQQLAKKPGPKAIGRHRIENKLPRVRAQEAQHAE